MIIMQQAPQMAGVVGPGQIEAEMDSLHRGVESLNADVGSQLPASDPWVSRWHDFRDEFGKWYEKNNTWWGRLWGTTYDEALGYRKRLESWQADFETKKGGVVIGPKLPPPPVPPPSADAFAWVKRAAIIGAAGLGVVIAAPYVIPFVAKQVRKTRSTMGETT